MQTFLDVILQHKPKKTNGMKKILLIIGIMFSLFAMHANAEQTKRQVYVERSNYTIGTKVHRAPMVLPTVELVYDTDNNSINVICSCECDAEVTVYDTAGNIVAISDIGDTIFVQSSNDCSYNVIIEAESWYGTAKI